MAFNNIVNMLSKAQKLLQQTKDFLWQQFMSVSIFGVAVACKANSLYPKATSKILLPKRHNFEKKCGTHQAVGPYIRSTVWWVPLLCGLDYQVGSQPVLIINIKHDSYSC